MWVGLEIFLRNWVFHTVPESVAKPMRKALFFSSIRPDPQRAMKFYREALFAAQEANMHPLDQRVLGIKLQIAHYFEDTLQSYLNAIKVYENTYKECVEWLDREGEQHYKTGHRSRILAAQVRMAIKLGQLYSAGHIGRYDDAEDIMTNAGEIVVMERLRREKVGVQPGEGDFLPDEEVGASIEGKVSQINSPKLQTWAA
jgi:hypothetical protein